MTTSEPTTERPTCYVSIGFGRKADLSTGRVLDLSLTYERLIKPALDAAGVVGFRAVDLDLSNSGKNLVYHWLYHADIVLADLSTFGGNVLYELGLRHAMKPSATIVISDIESMHRIPMDLSHMVIHAYEHLGEEIADLEAERFVRHLTSMVQAVLDDPGTPDSPAYALLPGMNPPEYHVGPVTVPAAALAFDVGASGETSAHLALSSLVNKAEDVWKMGEFATAIPLFEEAIERDPTNIFLRQRLALCTYKKGQREDDKTAIQALRDAEAILRVDDPKTSKDPETLGLSAAINKRLFDLSGARNCLDTSISFYERGFYLSSDYYSGINVAYLYTVRADLQEELLDAIADYGRAHQLRREVVEICLGLIARIDFDLRGDKVWVYATLAEAYHGLGLEKEREKIEATLEASAEEFVVETVRNQREKLAELLQRVETRLATARLDGTLVTPAAPDNEQAKAHVADLTAVAGSELTQLSATLRNDFGRFLDAVQVLLGQPGLAPERAPSSPADPSPALNASTVAERVEADSPPPASRPPAQAATQRLLARTPELPEDRQPSGNRVFISYSHDDGELWLKQLMHHLQTYHLQGLLEVWHDKKIQIGTNWDEVIKEELSSAKIAVLLVTPGFMNSEYIQKEELPVFLDAKERGVRIVWIHAEKSLTKLHAIESIQAASNPDEPLGRMPVDSQQDTLIKICEQIADIALEPSS